ncbi:uncharacterized protein NECHADRAFT_90259 [Fusarium vanettenii 77-13-4]|uniref:LsmAD domain-containing protein n=1 Tax=Fusarium vanettenii (strain ATCC MYA-4622 / CBS 123669 / FGSC 9596 / NRRL 45880 / 77-13-4) TaxID=660122 RepID=C7YHZ6_FUSV7|nr:uncharacterized protein NECHADRAFT_90259 [Fusarium vanettenii 77-13-4]EEU48001.1 hypothetical protein NECHADRAFT_90259 [Fusarium vanettenii 77-13-4]
MPVTKKDGIAGGGPGGKQNGNRASFRTDSAISNNRFGNERVLQPWVPDTNDAVNGSLERSGNNAGWDQFAENERLFGLTTDYDENIYTTAINKSHPQYRERIAAADRKAREIERSAPTTAHVAEERIMDYVGGDDGGDEEDKYSGVRRQDFPPLSGRENKYTPPAKRAPTAQSTVKGAPVDPAIISSQIKAPAKKQPTPVPEEPKPQTPDANKNVSAPKVDAQKVPAEAKPAEAPANSPKPAAQPANGKATETKSVDKTNAALRPSASGAVAGAAAPSATSTVEHDVLKEFKSFASQQRQNAEKARSNKAKADKEVKLTELKKFASSFKLSTPVPTDLVSIIAKDPVKQKEIQAKAIKNAEDVAKAKAEAATKDKTSPSKDAQAKPAGQGAPAAASATSGPSNDNRSSRPATGTQATPPAGGQGRHPGARQQYPQQQYHAQQYRNNRGGPHVPQQQQTGMLAQRLRNVEQQKYSQASAPHQPHVPGQEIRAPPTGPASGVSSDYNRRLSGAPGHMGAKLNPNSHEFRPSPFAAAFNPNGHPSAGSSPRSSVNHVEASASNVAAPGQLIRRKTKAIDVKKCYILSHIQTFTPPPGRNWDDNGGLRPAYDTLPTWRQLQDDEKPDSTMHLNYKEYFERQPFNGPALATPNPQHVVPQMPHQHQLPFHLQQGAHNMAPRGSPHMPPMQMHTPQHGPVPHPQYGNDDHRMMHSNSAQSFASPRLGNVPVAYNSPAQVPYNQPVFMPGTPQMGQFRSFSNNPQYMSPQQGQMGGPMMMQPQFIPGPQGMVPGPQMMYPGGHPQFMPPSGPQPVPGVNGYPSPGRPAAPMMAHQGSQQGQPMYGMSPNVQYNQPVFNPGQQGGPMRGGYGSPGPQHFGTSPQQGHQYGPQHRSGSTSYNKGYAGPGPHQTPQPNHAVPAANQGRPAEGSNEAK